MKRLTWILLPAVLAALLLPAGAAARPLDLLRKAKLQSATGTLTISESRCPAGSTNCGATKLTQKFDSGAKPRTRSVDGRTDFPVGLRIPGKGTGDCYEESPVETVTAPDGSQMILSSARLDPGSFDATKVVAANRGRGVRFAWLEPLAPGIVCDYFGEPDSALALPAARQLPGALISPVIGTRTLKRSRFSVTIAGSQEWNDAAADGTQIAGRASWRLRLDYAR